jgi:hypothetical protein
MKNQPKRNFTNRILSAFLFAFGAFALGATVLSIAAGPISSPRAIVVRLLMGVVMSVIAAPIGLFVSVRIATASLVLSLLLAVPSLIGSIGAQIQLHSPLICENRTVASPASVIFRNDYYKVSFRYPASWERVHPQSPTTLVLLYAQDGSLATCNLSVIDADAESVSEYNVDYFSRVFAPRFDDFCLHSVEYGFVMGHPISRVIWTSSFNCNGESIPTTTMANIIIKNGKRFMLIFNVPTQKLDLTRHDFLIISSTLVFDG